MTRAVVPDQLKSAVTKACRYDPAIQRTTAELGRHYATTILPARPRSPRDKAKVEVGVQIAERWLLARPVKSVMDAAVALLTLDGRQAGSVDVSTVKELARRWYPESMAGAPTKAAGHRAMDDIRESVAELAYYRATVFRDPSPQ